MINSLQTNKVAYLERTGNEVVTFTCPLCNQENKRIIDTEYVRSKQKIDCSYCKLLLKVN